MAPDRLLVVLALAVAPAIAVAAPARSYAVEVTPASDWRATALALALEADLADDRLALARGANPELTVRATIGDGAIRYELRAAWPGAPAPIAGELELGIDRATAAAQLRDHLHRLARTTRDDQAEVVAAPPGASNVLVGIVFAVVLLAIPFAIARRFRLPALRHAAIVVGGIGGAAMAISWLGTSAPWLLAGGLAWGGLVAVTVPIMFPPVIGFGRIEHEELARVIGAWLASTARRSFAIAALYTPIAILTWIIGDGLGLDPTMTAALAIPLALLTVRLAARCAVAVAAEVLDESLVDTATDPAAWHAATRAYVVGYLRRAGLEVDVELLSRVRLLPGRGDEVAVYGGGLTDSRIVLPRRMLELALAPAGRPHDYAAPRVSTLHWAQWNAGLVTPTELGAIVATREQRQPREMTVEPGDRGPAPKAAERELFGEPPTLAGTIEPMDLDPRRAYRPHEDPIWLDWDPGAEDDGTDAGDRDFLFGAVIHAFGEIQRHADRWATLVLLLPRSAPRRWLERTPALADDHAALGGARHHLVQYLGWRLWQREDLLTARAFAPELEAATRRTLAALADNAPIALRRRLQRLADPKRPARWQRLAFAGALAGGVAVAALAVANAVHYHSTYAKDSHGKD